MMRLNHRHLYRTRWTPLGALSRMEQNINDFPIVFLILFVYFVPKTIKLNNLKLPSKAKFNFGCFVAELTEKKTARDNHRKNNRRELSKVSSQEKGNNFYIWERPYTATPTYGSKNTTQQSCTQIPQFNSRFVIAVVVRVTQMINIEQSTFFVFT